MNHDVNRYRIVAAALILPHAAHAQLSIVEPGDFGVTPVVVPLPLGPGTNTITGRLSGDDTRDTVALTVPEGLTVRAARVAKAAPFAVDLFLSVDTRDLLAPLRSADVFETPVAIPGPATFAVALRAAPGPEPVTYSLELEAGPSVSTDAADASFDEVAEFGSTEPLQIRSVQGVGTTALRGRAGLADAADEFEVAIPAGLVIERAVLTIPGFAPVGPSVPSGARFNGDSEPVSADDIEFRFAVPIAGPAVVPFELFIFSAETEYALVLEASGPPAILSQPRSVTVRDGAPAEFALRAAGGGLAYRWQTGDGVDLPASPPFFGVDGPRLFVEQPDALAAFRCVVSNAAGSVTSELVFAAPEPPDEPTDLNRDGVLDFFDALRFLADFDGALARQDTRD